MVVAASTCEQLSEAAVVERARTLETSGFGTRMRALSADLLQGAGFAVLRGLPVAAWGRAKSAAAFLLLCRLLGPLRMQNAAGHILGHVRDLGRSSSDPSVRVYQTAERQTFHTDSCDVVGLLCLQRAMSGGSSSVVSAGAIFNRLLAQRPDLLPLLLQPIATDRRGEVPPGAAPFFLTPVFSLHGGLRGDGTDSGAGGSADLLTVIYQRQYIDSAQRFPDAPRLTPAHVAALDLFDALADDPAMQCSMDLEPGDVQLCYNHVLLHDRTAFADFPGEPARQRHLLRAWVAAEGARPLPPAFAQRFGSVVVGARGGVALDGLVIPVAPLLAPGEEGFAGAASGAACTAASPPVPATAAASGQRPITPC